MVGSRRAWSCMLIRSKSPSGRISPLSPSAPQAERDTSIDLPQEARYFLCGLNLAWVGCEEKLVHGGFCTLGKIWLPDAPIAKPIFDTKLPDNLANSFSCFRTGLIIGIIRCSHIQCPGYKRLPLFACRTIIVHDCGKHQTRCHPMRNLALASKLVADCMA